MADDSEIKLVSMDLNKPAPTNHPEGCMHLTLEDIKRMRPRTRTEPIPFAFHGAIVSKWRMTN